MFHPIRSVNEPGVKELADRIKEKVFARNIPSFDEWTSNPSCIYNESLSSSEI